MDAINWLSQLVSYDTTSRNSNLELIDMLETFFKKIGIQTHLTYSSDRLKANLLAVLPTHNGHTEGGTVLSGHMDVVPVDGQQWDSEPFQLKQTNGRLYGRGTADMKGFLAVVLSLVPDFLQSKRRGPIYLAFSYDEEVGCRGVPHLITDLLAQGIKPQACIVGEPTGMSPVIAHKGIQSFRCRIHGHATHSSLTPQGCNAIEYAAKLISYLRHLADELSRLGEVDPDFDVPFTTLSTNRIEGGIAHNIIPERCEFNFEFRHLPLVQPQSIIAKIESYAKTELLPQMQKENPKANIEIEPLATVPAFETIENAGILKLVRKITQNHETHKVAYATEAGLFQAAGIPTIVCGPGHIEKAHGANEYIDIDQLDTCINFLRNVVSL